MTDIEKLLRDSLSQAGDAYEPVHQADARRAFLRRAKRRRLYLGGSLALAGTALAGLVFFFVAYDMEADSGVDNETTSTIPFAGVDTRTSVGDAPAGLAVGRGSVWVANSGDGTISLIDVLTDRVTDTIEIGGTPLDVQLAGGYAWVSFENESRLVALGVDDLDRREVELEGGGTDLEIASAGTQLWAVSKDTPLQRIDPATFGVTQHRLTVDEPVTLTVGAGKVWVLGAEGAVDQIDEAAGLDPEVTFSLEAPVSSGASDLVWDGMNLWVSDGDSRTILRIDTQTGVVTTNVEFEGRYAHLASSNEGELWALVGNDSSDASLLLVDTETGRAASGSITLSGAPGGIAAVRESVWTVGSSSDSVYRTVLSSPSASPTPKGPSEEIPDDEILYIYPALGDLVAVYGDASRRALTQTAENESNPSFISEDTIVFERTDALGQMTVVTRDLVSGAEATTPIVGDEVAFGPEGRAAWVLHSDDPSVQNQIRVGSQDGSGEDFFVANPEFERFSVRNLEWDPTGDKLYYEAGAVGPGFYQVDLGARKLTPRAIDPPEGPAAYIGPAASRENEVVILKVCCSSDGYLTAELGRLDLGGGTPEYTRVAGLDDTGFDPNSQNVTVEAAGTLEVEGSKEDRLWSETPVRSWIVSDGSTTWLVDEEGEIDRLISKVTGAAVNPAFLE